MRRCRSDNIYYRRRVHMWFFRACKEEAGLSYARFCVMIDSCFFFLCFFFLFLFLFFLFFCFTTPFLLSFLSFNNV